MRSQTPEEPKDGAVSRAWICSIFGGTPEELTLIGEGRDAVRYKHPSIGEVGLCGAFLDASDIPDIRCHDGSSSKRYEAFRKGYTGGRSPSILHPLLRKSYNAGREMRASGNPDK